MPTSLQIAGARPPKPSRKAPLWSARFYDGLWTNRSPLRDGGSTHLEEKFYGARGDTLIDGLNTEITTQLTIARRPGLSVYNSATWDAPDCFYEFRLFNQNTEQIKVMVDTATGLYDGTGPSTQDLIWTKSAGAVQSYMQSVGNSLYFGNGVDKKKWLNTLLSWSANTSYALIPYDLNTFIVDTNGNIQQLINTIFTVTNVSITSNVLTITSSNTLTDTIQIGDKIVFAGLTGATFLNNLNPTTYPITVLTVGTNSFTADFTHANYSGTESGTDQATVLIGGTPVSGATQPAWNTNLLGITNDGTAQWRNRGSELENWGIKPPTSSPNLVVSGSSSSWQPNTFYSNSLVIVDSNGNLQKITTAGKSGATAPTWNSTLNGTTTDGTVTWTMVQTAASLSWAAHTNYAPGDFIVAAASGTPCLFQLQPYSGVQLASNLDVYLWDSPHSGAVATVTNTYPTSTSSALASSLGTLNSLLFAGTPLSSGADLAWVTLNGAGENVGTTNPFPSYTSNYQLSVNTSLVIPAAGNYTFTIKHEDGWFWGFAAGVLDVNVKSVQIVSDVLTITADKTLTDLLSVGVSGTFSSLGNATFLNGQTVTVTSVVGNQFTATFAHADYGPTAETTGTFAVTTGNTPTLISGPNTNNYGQTQTFVQGYSIISGLNGVAGGVQYTDTVVINFPIAGTYPVEIDYDYWYHSGQVLEITVNGNNIIPSPTESGSTQPVWPAWTTTYAPSYPSVTESSGNYTWYNLGPATDYTWHASTNFTTTPDIVDSNTNTENPYRAGVSGTTAPSWATSLNALTLDNPNLTWINQGPASAGPSGTLTATNGGWQYCLALVNTLDDTVSDAGPVSVSTGNFHAGTGVLVSGGLPSVIDSQVDYVAIFRTQDGGQTYYLIPGNGNTEYTVTLTDYQANGYTDTTQDTSLQTLIQAPLDEQNAVPPDGIINLTYHLSCIFGSVGNTVYWSTGAATPVGNGINGFSPSNYATFPSLVKCLVPLSYGILVFTVSDIYLLAGDNTANNPITPIPYLTDVGLLSYNALSVNGSIIYFYTSDGQLVSLEPSSGLAEISFPIGDQIEVKTGNTFHPSTAYVTWHVAGTRDKAIVIADGASTWFRMIPTPSPESGITWCPKAVISGGCKAVQSVETTPGTHNLLVGPSGSGPILYRDYSTNTDNGTAFAAYATLGSYVLAEPGQIADVEFITVDSKRVGKPMNLSVLFNEISGNFDPVPESTPDPTQLPAALSLYNQRFFLSLTTNARVCRHMQAKLSWLPEDAANEVLSFSVYGGYYTET